MQSKLVMAGKTLDMAGKKLDMAGKKPPKAFILPVATIRLTFVIGLIFIAMPLADAVKGEDQTANQGGLTKDDLAKLEKRIDRLNESMVGIAKSLVQHPEGKAGNSQNQTGQVEGMTGESQNQTGQVKGMTGKSQNQTGQVKGMTGESQDLTGYMKMMVQQFKDLIGYVKKMADESKEMTGQMKWMTKDAVEDLLATAGGCPLPWHYHDKRCYMYVHLLKTWDEARKCCVVMGGHLASVHTKATFDFLFGLVGGYQTWLGGYKRGGLWTWVDGSKFNVYGEGSSKHLTWSPGKPDNAGGNQDCVAMHSLKGLNDLPCNYGQPFFCQK
ncbi:C-type lectin domain family 10 member A-like [Dunckerocampus dactyliophorus]|uniref:C-type lectin domain family 10 member A-like n=1 Tax=Dunckerocampus dactyliophorus TaxID=161453 RepID=UPI002407138B|nr:C-type lectin domain family 10 member A-like [Dunckerocampus dactyliophorus]XP_054629019.1 C-type lectin domain family 10 member A-like [Dunckerocampus dactyliophorus]